MRYLGTLAIILLIVQFNDYTTEQEDKATFETEQEQREKDWDKYTKQIESQNPSFHNRKTPEHLKEGVKFEGQLQDAIENLRY